MACGAFQAHPASRRPGRSRRERTSIRAQSGLVGGGNGRIIGTGFTSTLDTRDAVDQGPNNVRLNSNNTIDGQFYGPRADEMAGLVRGNTTDGNGATAGYLIGTQ